MVCRIPRDVRRRGRACHGVALASRVRGFTLLEVLAALAVVGTALFVLLEAHYTSLRLNETTADEVYARQLLETVVAKAEVEVLAGTYADAGDFGTRYPDYTWSFDAVRYGEDDLSLLYQVSVTIHGPDEERTLQFYLYDTGLGSEEKSPGSGSGTSGQGNTRGSNAASSATGRSGFFGGQ